MSCRQLRLALASTLVVAGLAACTAGDRAIPTAVDGRASFATKASSTTPAITSVAPDSGAQSTTIDVKVNGSGFTNGMAVVWALSGTPDSTQIRTNRTTYVSAKQLIANITISGTATAAQWDVALYSGGKTGIGSEMSVLKGAFKVTDPTATWLFPLDDAALAVRSDRLYSNGTASAYAGGICGLSTTLFVSPGESGDAVLSTGNGNSKCIRRFTFVFPDGVTETLPSFNNLREIENGSYSIPIGATAERQLHMGSDTWSNVSSRCGGLVWGYGTANNIAAGSDSVLVTRVDASSWHVHSKAAPHNLAYCKTTGQLFPMPVDFTVVSSRPVP